MSDLTSALKTGIEFKFKDKTYEVSLLTQKIKGQFEKKNFSRARDAAMLLKEAMSPAEYAEHLSRLNDNYIAGVYGLHGDAGQSFAETPDGTILICSLLFGISEEEMTKLMLEARTEILAILQAVLAESFGSPQVEAAPEPAAAPSKKKK